MKESIEKELLKPNNPHSYYREDYYATNLLTIFHCTEKQLGLLVMNYRTVLYTMILLL